MCNRLSLLEHPSSSISFRFIWPSMNEYAPLGLVYTADWKLQLANLWSGDWWPWFKETGCPQFDWLHLVRPGIWTLTCNKGVGLLHFLWTEIKKFSQWLENVQNSFWATAPLYLPRNLKKILSAVVKFFINSASEYLKWLNATSNEVV